LHLKLRTVHRSSIKTSSRFSNCNSRARRGTKQLYISLSPHGPILCCCCDTLCIVTRQLLAPALIDCRTIFAERVLTKYWQKYQSGLPRSGLLGVSGLTGGFPFLRFFCRHGPTAPLEQWNSKADGNCKIRCLVLCEDRKIDSNHAT
jgi:hypothetical protein